LVLAELVQAAQVLPLLEAIAFSTLSLQQVAVMVATMQEAIKLRLAVVLVEVVLIKLLPEQAKQPIRVMQVVMLKEVRLVLVEVVVEHRLSEPTELQILVELVEMELNLQ